MEMYQENKVGFPLVSEIFRSFLIFSDEDHGRYTAYTPWADASEFCGPLRSL
jgi:hypothetical protein